MHNIRATSYLSNQVTDTAKPFSSKIYISQSYLIGSPHTVIGREHNNTNNKVKEYMVATFVGGENNFQ